MRAKVIDFLPITATKQRLTLELYEDWRPGRDKCGEEVDVTIKKYRPKRSLDANAYAWVLIDKIADRMHMSKAQVYRDHIRDIGGVSETVCVMDQAVQKLRDAWSQNGLGWQTDIEMSKIDGCTNVTLYYGSSTYDARQMSALIDALIETCKSVGIETMPPEKIKSLMEEKKK